MAIMLGLVSTRKHATLRAELDQRWEARLLALRAVVLQTGRAPVEAPPWPNPCEWLESIHVPLSIRQAAAGIKARYLVVKLVQSIMQGFAHVFTAIVSCQLFTWNNLVRHMFLGTYAQYQSATRVNVERHVMYLAWLLETPTS